MSFLVARACVSRTNECGQKQQRRCCRCRKRGLCIAIAARPHARKRAHAPVNSTRLASHQQERISVWANRKFGDPPTPQYARSVSAAVYSNMRAPQYADARAWECEMRRSAEVHLLTYNTHTHAAAKYAFCVRADETRGSRGGGGWGDGWSMIIIIIILMRTQRTFILCSIAYINVVRVSRFRKMLCLCSCVTALRCGG